jgi:drug/metabolite transporter (DMT)-like permease
MSSKTTNLTRGYTSAIISSLILATTAIFIRDLTLNYSLAPLVLAFLREVIVALTLLPVLLILRRDLVTVKLRTLPFLISYGLLLALFNGLWTTSVALNGAAVATVLVYCSAAFTAILGWLVLNESLSWGKLLAVAVCLGGCVLVAEAHKPEAWSTNLGGILTGVSAGLGYAVYSLMGRSASQRGLNPWTTLLYTFAFAAFFLLAANIMAKGNLPGGAPRPVDIFWPQGSFNGWGILLMLAAGPTLGGYGFYNISLSYLPSSIANLILTTEPVFTTTMAYIFLGERLNPPQIIGSAMVLAGVVFLRIYQGWQSKRRWLTTVRS